MLGADGAPDGSATCASVRGSYRDGCSPGMCRICKTSGGDLLDLRRDHVVRQGGYEASCREVDNILGGRYSSAEGVCADAKAQLADHCCYRQCLLCEVGTTGTDWYKAVAYGGLATTFGK
jgi:hypothetical protein